MTSTPSVSGSGGPIRVGVNLLWLVPGVVGGSEEYTTRLLRALAELSGASGMPADLHLTLFALSSFAEAHPDLVAAYPTVTSRLDGHRKAERVAAEATWLAREAAHRHVDLLHHAGGVIPPSPAPPGRGPARIASVLTIHDLQPLEMPKNFSSVKRRWLGTMLPRSARRAAMVLTPSDPTSTAVVARLGVPRARVRTVPHGVETPVPAPAGLLAEVKLRYRLERQVVLYPAITYPHKDHLTLVRAFAELLRQGRPDLTLVLTGGPGPSEGEVAAAIRAAGIGAQVRRTGRIPWSDLHALYELATVVAVPSRFEGFGAPALEAMAAGAPVVAADATALPWVLGDAGALVPPGDVGAWARALAGILDHPDAHRRLADAGRRRAAGFDWQRAGAALAAGYRAAGPRSEDGST